MFTVKQMTPPPKKKKKVEKIASSLLNLVNSNHLYCVPCRARTYQVKTNLLCAGVSENTLRKRIYLSAIKERNG